MIFTYAQQTWYHATERFYLLVLPALHWRGCRLSGPPRMAAGPFWHPVNVRLTWTLWEAEKDNVICWCLALLFGTWKALFKCLWQYTWAVSKRHVSLHWAPGLFFTGLSTEEFTVSQSSFWRLCTRGPATLQNLHPLHPCSVCYKREKTTQDWYLGLGAFDFKLVVQFLVQKPSFKLLIATSSQEELPEFLDWSI